MTRGADPHEAAQRQVALERRVDELEAQVWTARQSEDVLRSILDTVPSFILEVEPDGTIRFVNRVPHGVDAEHVIGKLVYDFTAPEYHQKLRETLATVMRERRAISFESVGVGPDGKSARYSISVTPLRRGERLDSVLMVANDITELREARAELHESGEKLAVLMEASGVGLWAWNAATDSLTWDAAVCRIFGRDSAPRSLAEYIDTIHPDDREMMKNHIDDAAKSGVFGDIEHRVLLPDGSTRWVMCRGRVVRGEEGQVTQMLGGVLNVTPHHELAEQLLRAQKMEAIGQLAAGIAHNFNNMLTVILSSMELAKRKSGGGDVASVLADGQQAAERAASMVRQLMLFAGKGKKRAPAVIDVSGVVARTVEMCRTTFPRDISLLLEDEPEPALVMGDPVEIEQAVLNLLINARDAVEPVESRPKEIRVSVRRDIVHQQIEVTVEDTGAGMPEEVRRRVFEPFFTTKEVGRGTGLGLAMTYAIVQDHGGKIEIDSSEDVGTKATITLRARTQRAVTQQRTDSKATLPGKGERVLIVDDEPMIRDLVAHVLTDSGYRVETAADGIEAIERVQGRVGEIRAVFLDQSMPRLAGRAALRALRGIDPGLKVICFSGYAAELEGADAVLEKPATAERLLSVLDRVLNGP